MIRVDCFRFVIYLKIACFNIVDMYHIVLIIYLFAFISSVKYSETPVVEKQVEEGEDVPKVVDDEVVENGKEATASTEEEVAENGTSEEADGAEAVVTSTPAEEVDAPEVTEEAKNGKPWTSLIH